MKKKKQGVLAPKKEVFQKFGIMADLDIAVSEAVLKAVSAGMPASVALMNVIGSLKYLMEKSGMNDEQIRDAFMAAFNVHTRIREEVKKRLG
jgi:hypothetical protein